MVVPVVDMAAVGMAAVVAPAVDMAVEYMVVVDILIALWIYGT